MILNTRNHSEDFVLERIEIAFSKEKDLICWFSDGSNSNVSKPDDEFVKMIYFPAGAVWVSSHDL